MRPLLAPSRRAAIHTRRERERERERLCLADAPSEPPGGALTPGDPTRQGTCEAVVRMNGPWLAELNLPVCAQHATDALEGAHRGRAAVEAGQARVLIERWWCSEASRGRTCAGGPLLAPRGHGPKSRSCCRGALAGLEVMRLPSGRSTAMHSRSPKWVSIRGTRDVPSDGRLEPTLVQLTPLLPRSPGGSEQRREQPARARDSSPRGRRESFIQRPRGASRTLCELRLHTR